MFTTCLGVRIFEYLKVLFGAISHLCHFLTLGMDFPVCNRLCCAMLKKFGTKERTVSIDL